ncbi:MAG: permease-like cell division protein FtsX [Woeseiaceae bacterium]|nr:permease-like cell division protein FtsX [Woeseiaceae bacterium]MDJ0938365.1 permease-like cell division protein FtsX [Woeseiaceae bacterium]
MSAGAGKSRHADAATPVRSSGPLSIWFGRHVSEAGGSISRLARQPVASLMIVLVIAVTLALPAALNLVIKNAASISGRWDSALDFSVFLDRGLTVSEAEGLARLIRQRADVAAVELITADMALADFKAQSGFGDAMDQLNENPLPHTLVVRPGPANTEQSIILLREELANLPETELVQVDTEWVQRFHAILDIVRQAVLIGGVLLGAAIVVIIGNTIRLDIQNRREEIEVTKLIGASDAFVRRPFLWTGFWYGLLGALLAIGLVQYGLYLLEAPIARLAGLYQSSAAVVAFSFAEVGTILGIGIGLGLVGSWFAAARHMRRIEPR